MAYRIPYQAEYLYVGPSPSTGCHFMDYTGLLNDKYYDLQNNHNLLKSISRVQDISFSLEDNRTEVRQLGVKSLVDRYDINPPKISLSFSYLLNGLANDARLGLNVNYAQFQYPYSGTPYYPDNFSVNLLSGLCSRDFTRPTGDPYWPYSMRDNRNIFLVRKKDNQEIIKFGGNSFLQPDLTHTVDPLATGYEVMAFSHCYLESYQTQAAVNALPLSKASYSCEGASFYLSGSGCYTPAVNLQTRQLMNQLHFNVPEPREETPLSVLQPGDILLSLTSASGGNLTGFYIDIQNSYINAYSLSFAFNRDSLNSIGYMSAIDKEITFPVLCNLSFNMTVGNIQSGCFIDRLNSDIGYNVDIKLRNPSKVPFPLYSPSNLNKAPRHSGPAFGLNETSVWYAFRNAKFNSSSYSSAIGSNATATLNFSVEVGNEDYSRCGLFISGDLGIDKLSSYLLDESGFALIDESSGAFVLNNDILY